MKHYSRLQMNLALKSIFKIPNNLLILIHKNLFLGEHINTIFKYIFNMILGMIKLFKMLLKKTTQTSIRFI